MVEAAPSATAVLATYATLLLIALVMICARFVLRIKIHQSRRLLVSDLLMGAAWCAAFTTASFDVILSRKGALDPKIDYILTNYDASVGDYEYVARMVWASVIPFYATLYLCKLSIVAVYFQLFPVFMIKLRIALWITLGFCISSWVVSMALQLFMCLPIEGNWRISKPETMCAGTTIPQTIFQVGWALHFAGSIAVFVLPFFVIYKVQMRPAMMIGVYGTLSLGAVDIAFSLTRFLKVENTHDGNFRAITTVELWSALDIMVGLIVTCLPSLRPYLRRDFKASSGSNSMGFRSTTAGASQNITVNRKITTSTTPGRWVDHGQFEEIVGDEGEGIGKNGESHGRIVMIGNDVQVDGGGRDEENNRSRDSWQDDKRSNNSDVELIQMKA